MRGVVKSKKIFNLRDFREFIKALYEIRYLCRAKKQKIRKVIEDAPAYLKLWILIILLFFIEPERKITEHEARIFLKIGDKQRVSFHRLLKRNIDEKIFIRVIKKYPPGRPKKEEDRRGRKSYVYTLNPLFIKSMYSIVNSLQRKEGEIYTAIRNLTDAGVVDDFKEIVMELAPLFNDEKIRLLLINIMLSILIEIKPLTPDGKNRWNQLKILLENEKKNINEQISLERKIDEAIKQLKLI